MDFSIGELSLKLLPQNWFIVLYVALYLISPYINIIIRSLDRKSYRNLLVLLISLFSIYPTCIDLLHQWTSIDTSGLSTVGMYGSQYGYTIVQFVLLYFIGGYISKYPITVSKRKLYLLSLVVVLILTLWSYLDKISGYTVHASAYEYCNPLVVLEAGLLLMIFLRTTFKSKLINALSKSSFTMYLLHTLAYQFMDIKGIVNQSPMIMMLYILLSGIFTYLICYIIYDSCMKYINKYIKRLCSNANR